MGVGDTTGGRRPHDYYTFSTYILEKHDGDWYLCIMTVKARGPYWTWSAVPTSELSIHPTHIYIRVGVLGREPMGGASGLPGACS